jgi:hypothetical protein
MPGTTSVAEQHAARERHKDGSEVQTHTDTHFELSSMNDGTSNDAQSIGSQPQLARSEQAPMYSEQNQQQSMALAGSSGIPPARENGSCPTLPAGEASQAPRGALLNELPCLFVSACKENQDIGARDFRVPSALRTGRHRTLWRNPGQTLRMLKGQTAPKEDSTFGVNTDPLGEGISLEPNYYSRCSLQKKGFP